ncbi:hypothetical protein GO491_10665 [Flavobacteriaceae bacterium Ap0902]|nr:hypothetical protein [Flavobacteriaceae bacterium Ap0902]
MWIKFLITMFVMVALDYLILTALDAYLFKYFLIVHAVFISINASILFLYQYLKTHQADFVGLGIMAGLVLKMLFALGIFVVMYNKLHLNDIQIINFLFVYFCYTIVFLLSVLKLGK